MGGGALMPSIHVLTDVDDIHKDLPMGCHPSHYRFANGMPLNTTRNSWGRGDSLPEGLSIWNALHMSFRNFDGDAAHVLEEFCGHGTFAFLKTIYPKDFTK